MSNDSANEMIREEEERMEAVRRHFEQAGTAQTKRTFGTEPESIIDAAWQQFRASEPNDLRCRMMLSVLAGVLVGLEKAGRLDAFGVEKVAERLSGKRRGSV